MEQRWPQLQMDPGGVFSLFMRSPLCVAAFSGPDHRVYFANPRCLQAAGLHSAQAVAGWPVRELFPELEQQDCFELLDQVYVSGQALSGRELPLTAYIGSDTMLSTRYFDVEVEALRGQGGTADGVLLQAADVTEQVRARHHRNELTHQSSALYDYLDAVLRLLRRQDAFADASPDHMVLLDPNGRVLSANRAAAEALRIAAALGGQRVDDLTEYTCRELGLPAMFVDELEAASARAMTAQRVSVELSLPGDDGQRVFEYVLSPVVRDDGIVEAIAATGRDVSLRRLEQAAQDYRTQVAQTETALQTGRNADLIVMAEAQSVLRHDAEERIVKLEDLARQKDDFIAVASHELKTPLTTISGYVQLLLRRVRNPQPDLRRIEESLMVIHEEVRALSLLLEDLLDASRIQMGTLDLRTAPCDLAECLHAVLARLGPHERARVSVTMDDAPLAGVWERQKIEQVLTNLVSNALKYSPGGEPIGVTVRRSAGGVDLAVRDRGIGIHPDELHGLFERFHRTREARATGVPGTGLGLYICRGIITAHGGRIWAESSGASQGSTFRFTLPALSGDSAVAEQI